MDPLLMYVRAVRLNRGTVEEWDQFPFNIPAIATMHQWNLTRPVTFLVGENGSGKSTIMEAIAIGLGFAPAGGSRNMMGQPGAGDTLVEHLAIVKGAARPQTTFFLRAETFFNVSTGIERLGVGEAYGRRSLLQQSHGESFLSLVNHRFGPNGLYLLDEPEAALSPSRQLSLLRRMHDLVREGSQFIVATHSPILLALPGAEIWHLDQDGMSRVAYEDTEHFTITRDFLQNPARFLRTLLDDG